MLDVRRWFASRGLLAFLVCMLEVHPARAQTADRPPPAAQPIVPPARLIPRTAPARASAAQPESPRWFRGELALSYLAPLAAFGMIALTANKDNIVVPVLVGLVGLSAPPLVHSFNDDRDGALRSLAGMLGGGGVGALTGTAIGAIDTHEAARSHAQHRDAAIFGVSGYTIWALLDIGFFAFSRSPSSFVTASVAPRADGIELRLRGTTGI